MPCGMMAAGATRRSMREVHCPTAGMLRERQPASPKRSRISIARIGHIEDRGAFTLAAALDSCSIAARRSTAPRYGMTGAIPAATRAAAGTRSAVPGACIRAGQAPRRIPIASLVRVLDPPHELTASLASMVNAAPVPASYTALVHARHDQAAAD